MGFLNSYLRYCSVQKSIFLKGDEIIVELGPGLGYQMEVLKKLYLGITILCFDLPVQIYLCESYLLQAYHDKETRRKACMENPIKFNDYNTLLLEYTLVERQNVYSAFSESGRYFMLCGEKTVIYI